MSEMDEIIREFLIESNDGLEQMDRDLLGLEQNSTLAPLLANIFRTIHTIKGTGGVLGFTRLEAVAHLGENVLSHLRDGKMIFTPELASALLVMADALRWYLKQIETSGQEGECQFEEVKNLLTSLLNGTAEGPESAASEADSAAPSSPAAVLPTPTAPPAEATAETAPPRSQLIGEILVSSGAVTPEAVAEAVRLQSQGDPRRLGQIIVDKNQSPAGAVLEALNVQANAHLASASSSIRVDVGLLDKVMNLVGELVLARNQILQFTTAQQDAAFLGTAQRLNLITTELQEGVMKTRMQPIGNIWNKFPRVVRDLALQFHKRIRLEMEGSDTELDKTIIEAVKDPLIHAIRNSADHGIELPEVREAAGKPGEGRLVLRAFHEGGQVNIEISDDGAGIDLARVKKKAMARGLVSPDQAARMSDRELTNLVFLPGVSTAEAVSKVSGRGVGMDVVRTKIEKIGGTVDIHSVAGQGTTLRIKIPLTLAIIPALIVTSAGERFAIPQVNLLELVRLEGEQSGKGIENLYGAPVYRLRGDLLPLVFLDKELCLSSAMAGPAVLPAADDSLMAANIVVLQADHHQFGLVVDEINDTEEIVVKPLGKQLKGISSLAGATIMGDGQVALILDILGLAQKASVISGGQNRARSELVRSELDGRDAQSWLVFQIGSDSQMAVPLSQVSRLEEFDAASIEQAASTEVVQYRGHIMPLVRVAQAMGIPSNASAEAPLQVIVYSGQKHSVGLVVDRILDVVEQRVVIEQRSNHGGRMGSAVIRQRVTDLLDIPQLVSGMSADIHNAAAWS